MAKTEYERDSEGNVLNPPVLPEYEARLAAAHNAADTDAIEEVQNEYNKARDKITGGKSTPKPATKSNGRSR